MNDSTQCVIISQQLGSSPESEVADKLQQFIHISNTKGVHSSNALNRIGINNIDDCVTSANAVAFLLKNGSVVRVRFESKRASVAATPTSSVATSSAPAPSGAAAAARSSQAKFRRVMLSASSFRRGDRGGVIIDRSRPMMPAASVPEDLIAQAQVVLQGKSREVIVRELQRTNLNVNEAVNNLLSRDDDEEDGDDSAGEVVLPEELLSLLDPTQHPGLLDVSDMYGDNYEYILGRESRRRAEKEKEKKSKDSSGSPEATQTTRSVIELDDTIEMWCAEEKALPPGVERFVKITATKSEILAVTDTGVIYGWNWSEQYGEKEQHAVAGRLIRDDVVVDISSSALRVVVVTKQGRLASWLDHWSVGIRVCQATEIAPVGIFLKEGENISQIMVSDHLAVIRTSMNAFHWCGMYPVCDRPKMWEKERAKSRKHVTFDTATTEVKEGSEVRTKACPIYAAGSVAINMALEKPMVGVLMESVWSISEMCRFRVVDPLDFDKDLPSADNTNINQSPEKSIPAPGESRKRPATDLVFETKTTSTREEAWGVGQVVWIHEQHTQDSAIVKIVDGAYVGVEYVPSACDTIFASSLSVSLSNKDTNSAATGRMRLMRKDDLCVMTPRMKSARSPRILQKDPIRFVFSGSSSRKVISAVADSSGIRALVEKRGRVYVTRASITGKVLSDHIVPVHPAALYGYDQRAPALINYGEDSILLLRDGNGSLLPLIRDATMGFSEPRTLHLPPIRHVALTAAITGPSPGCTKPAPRKVILVAISGASEAAAYGDLPSLMQMVLYADHDAVVKLLDRLGEIGDPALLAAEVASSRSDSGSNILHAAIRMAVAKKNKEDADSGMTHGIRLREEDTKMAREEAHHLDQKWQRLLRSSTARANAVAAASGAALAQDDSILLMPPMQDNASQSHPSGDTKSSPSASAISCSGNQDMPMLSDETAIQSATTYGSPIEDAKLRQLGAIETIRVLLDHPSCSAHLSNLLTHRDCGGLTPFQLAVNIRAYGAALHIWNAIKTLYEASIDAAMLRRMIHPSGSRPDDSPLFLLCFNDTCSFSWTGEEHINQDIFECRTCGLTGTLCCCTECAFTCHRNHDCKLKRTSPTAYCDCWEKCPCKALVAGNQDKREFLLKELLKFTDLHEQTNNRGDHIMLFLARTLGRQQVEQANYNKRRRHPAAVVGDNANTPEHDLEPPKFAKFALEACISEWSVVKSLVNVGVRPLESLPPVYEDVLSLHSQNGSTHLDKFVFILLSKCGDKVATRLVDTMIMAANVSDGVLRDVHVDKVISRLVRSVIRLYTLCVLLSPTAAATAIRGKTTAIAAPQSERRYHTHTLSISGFFSLMRNDGSNKEPKLHAVANVVARCRGVLMRLAPYAVQQAAYSADSLLAPVRYGVVRPTASFALSASQDCLDVIEKYLNGEHDLTTQLSKVEEAKEKAQPKRRRTSRRDTDRGTGDEDEGRRDDSDEDSDSDGDGQSSRRHNSQSGHEDSAAETATEHTWKRKTGLRPQNLNIDENDSDGESSSDSDSDEDEEEGHVMVEDDENMDDEDIEEEDREGYGDTSEGDLDNTFIVGQDGQVEDERNQENDEQDDARSPMYDAAEVFHDDHDDDNTNDVDANGEGEGDRANAAAGDAEGEPNASDATDPINDNVVDEDNTRDAVFSESSDRVDSIEERRARQSERDVEAELSAVMDRMPPPSSRPSFAASRANRSRRNRTSSGGTPSMAWTVRHSARDVDDDNWQIDSSRGDEHSDMMDRVRPDDRNGNTQTTRAPPTTQNNSAAASSPVDRQSRRSSKTDEHAPSIHQANYQLSCAFAFSVRLLCDLIRHFHQKPNGNDILLNWNENTLKDVMSKVIVRMEPVWNWMNVVMDRLEAQLLFGNAITASAVGELRAKMHKKKESSSSSSGTTTSGGVATAVAAAQARKEKAHEEQSGRRDAMEYLLATMRSQAGEAGDDFPIFDGETLHSLIFVFDAHLTYHEVLESCKEDLMKYGEDEPRGDETYSTGSQAATMRRFFQRSSSVCYPGAASSDAWDTLCGNGSQIPLAEKSHLLTPDAAKETLFAPPPQTHTWDSFREVSASLGRPHVLNMSLAEPLDEERLQTSDDDGTLEEEEMDVGEAIEHNATQHTPEGMEPMSIEAIRAHLSQSVNVPVNSAMARWKNVLLYMAKECHQELLDSFGGEPGNSHMLTTIAHFPVRQSLFRKLMDKYRTTQSKDITLEVHRDPAQLVRDTVFQLNQTYVRRQNAPRSREDSSNNGSGVINTPMGSARVKVKFHDEPGEGSGVARSFFTALADSLQSLKSLPFEELGWEGKDDYLFGGLTGSTTATNQSQSASRDRSSIGRIAVIRDRGSSASAILSRKRPVKRHALSISSVPYKADDLTVAEHSVNSGAYRLERQLDDPTRGFVAVADAVYFKVYQARSSAPAAARITGMIVDLPVSVATQIIASSEMLKQYMDDAIALLLQSGSASDLALLSQAEDKAIVPHVGAPFPTSDDAPLFIRTCRRGLFMPCPGKLSPMRINTFRNVGRMIGLCLSQVELFPIKLARHVLKYILGRPMNWLDLQFYDVQIFESLRQILEPHCDSEFFDAMQLRFVVDVPAEEANAESTMVELCEGGAEKIVTRENVVEYVYLFVEMKMLGPRNNVCLAAMRQGVRDVIPANALQGLTAEDLRLLMCGAEQICVGTLQAMTTFSDESHSTADTIAKFKQWFWSVVEGLSSQEKQELIFFWTGAPSLPTGAESYQPQPTVMVRPPDDIYLPTANTCISRLYVPLYSSKRILRTKLQLAIKSKNFGFV